MKNKTCCFTGHRKIPHDKRELIVRRLEYIVEKLILKGYCFFGTGGAYGFDTLAAQTVLKLREKYPHIRLILVLPCKDQYTVWKKKQRDIYENIKSMADKVVYMRENYSKEAMLERNRHMVNCSSVCVCYMENNGGGTSHTVWYAKQKGIRVVNIA